MCLLILYFAFTHSSVNNNVSAENNHHWTTDDKKVSGNKHSNHYNVMGKIRNNLHQFTADTFFTFLQAKKESRGNSDAVKFKLTNSLSADILDNLSRSISSCQYKNMNIIELDLPKIFENNKSINSVEFDEKIEIFMKGNTPEPQNYENIKEIYWMMCEAVITEVEKIIAIYTFPSEFSKMTVGHHVKPEDK